MPSPSPPLEGQLREGILSSVLRSIYLGQRTGLLHVRNGRERGSVCFVDGHIVYGDTTIEECHMGDTLVRHGMLSPADLGRALGMMQAQGCRLGQVLLQLKILDAEGLQEALALQVREVLKSVFTWREGSYVFEARGTDAFRGYDRPLPLSTGEVILDAVWSITDPAVIRYALGDLERVLVATADPLLRFQRVTLSPTDGFLLSRVDGTLTAREVLDIAVVGGEEAERSLFGLLSIGMLEFVEGARSRAHADPTIEAVRARILEVHGRVTTRDHFEVLGVTRTAGAAEVKTAFLRLAKEFHPDVHHQPALADLRNRLTAVFARITEAYDVLSDPATRAAFEATQHVPDAAPADKIRVKETTRPPEPPAPPDPGLASQRLEDAVSRADEHYAAGQYWEVLQTLPDELLSNVQGRAVSCARTLRAQCHLKNPEAQRQAEAELKAVVAQDPGFSEAYFLLGTIYRTGGANALAASMFRKVLELKPRHPGAREELAALEGAPLPAPGLFSRLLRRS